MDERYIASVDLGSSKIALTVAKITGEDIQILYYNETPSDGVRNSAVFNPSKAAKAIHANIHSAEEELKIKIRQVVVGLPRCDVKVMLDKAEVERTNPDESITDEEIETLKSMAQDNYPLDDPQHEQLYGAVAQSFSTDEEFQLVESDIVGVISAHLEGNFKLFIGKSSSVKTIDNVFNTLKIAIARKYFTPGTLAKAVLREDEMDNGVALVDFGAGATSVAIYSGKIMRYYGAIPFGGNVITSDIRKECTISENLAENIKLAWGACQPERLAHLEDKIIQIEEEELGYKQIPVKYLSEIITARTKEIVEAILYHIQQSGLADDLRCGIVITGGGVELANLVSYVKELSGMTVRKGYPRPLFSSSGCPGIKEASATNSIGMILAAKADGTVSCIDAPEEEEEEDVTFTVGAPEAPAVSEHVSGIYTPIEDLAAQFANDESAQVPEDEEEEAPGSLFKDEEVPEPKKKEKKPKEKKPKKTPFIVKWAKKATQTFYENFSDSRDTINSEDI